MAEPWPRVANFLARLNFPDKFGIGENNDDAISFLERKEMYYELHPAEEWFDDQTMKLQYMFYDGAVAPDAYGGHIPPQALELLRFFAGCNMHVGDEVISSFEKVVADKAKYGGAFPFVSFIADSYGEKRAEVWFREKDGQWWIATLQGCSKMRTPIDDTWEKLTDESFKNIMGWVFKYASDSMSGVEGYCQLHVDKHC